MGRQNEGVDPKTESTSWLKTDTLTIKLNGNVKKWLSISGAIIAIFISLYPYVSSYFRTKAMIEAHQNEICDLKKSFQELNTKSQMADKEISNLKLQNDYTNKAIDEIKRDLQEIKKLLINSR